MKAQPDLLVFSNGKPVTTKEEFAERRKELVSVLAHEEYGFLPPVLGKPRWTLQKTNGERFCAGLAEENDMTVTLDTDKGEFTFPVKLLMPKTDKKLPLVVFLSFSKSIYNRSFPVEEVLEGAAVAYICYEDVTSDDIDMTNGLAGMFSRPTDGTGFGKISIWAYAASRVLDCLLETDWFDEEKTAVIGHSRLGKTALWCGANDERFKFVISNNSGCSGAAYERIKHENSETIASITKVFPYWFCENMYKYASAPDERKFDQHFLLAAMAPRHVLVGSSALDDWADPYSEQLSLYFASDAFRLFENSDYEKLLNKAEVGEEINSGKLNYHLRAGEHFLSRKDWLIYMKTILSE